MSCFIYAIKTLDHVHYVGSAFNVRMRAKGHLCSTGSPAVREAIRNGARFETLLECEQSEGYRIERAVILSLKLKGQCELNRKLPGGNRLDRSLVSETMLCCPVQTPDGKTVYKSKSDAARRLGISFQTITNMLKRGELLRSAPLFCERFSHAG